MVTRYVWWDEKQRVKRRRLDVRMPEPLHDFLRQVAQVHGVSVNDVICGVVAYAAECGRSLVVTVEPRVRVQEGRTADVPAEITVPLASPSSAKRWPKGKVL